MAGDDFGGGRGRKQRKERKQEATGVVDSGHWSLKVGREMGMVGRETDVCKLSACERF